MYRQYRYTWFFVLTSDTFLSLKTFEKWVQKFVNYFYPPDVQSKTIEHPCNVRFQLHSCGWPAFCKKLLVTSRESIYLYGKLIVKCVFLMADKYFLVVLEHPTYLQNMRDFVHDGLGEIRSQGIRVIIGPQKRIVKTPLNKSAGKRRRPRTWAFSRSRIVSLKSSGSQYLCRRGPPNCLWSSFTNRFGFRYENSPSFTFFNLDCRYLKI